MQSHQPIDPIGWDSDELHILWNDHGRGDVIFESESERFIGHFFKGLDGGFLLFAFEERFCQFILFNSRRSLWPDNWVGCNWNKVNASNDEQHILINDNDYGMQIIDALDQAVKFQILHTFSWVEASGEYDNE